MENEKIFHNRDAFFIAEALDALGLAIPVPLHLEKEFHNKDAFIIWTKIRNLVGLGLLSVKVSLNSDQVKVLNSIPVMAAAAPGAGRAIQVIGSSARLLFNSVAFTSASLVLTENGAAAQQYEVGFYLSSVANNFKMLFPQSIDNNVVENAPLMIQADADSLVGDSPVDVYVLYRIITL